MRLARPRVSRPVDEWSRELQRSAQQRGQNISRAGSGKPPTCHPRTCSAPIKALFKIMTVMSAVKRESATVEMMGIGHGGWFSTW